MPQAILLEDVETLGERGTVVDVSKGYLRNFLIPRKLAEPATRGSVAAAQRRQEAGDDGRLFGAVTSQDIVDAIKDARSINIDRRKVHLEEPIKTVGTRMVTVEVGDGVLANVKTMVVEQK